VPKWKTIEISQANRRLQMDITTVGVDIAKKNVIQLHYIDAETGEIVNKPVKRTAFLRAFYEPVAVPDRDGGV
jgi:hypothetical protein